MPTTSGTSVRAFLPGAQTSLEAEWKRELWNNHEIRFDALYTITHMPISRRRRHVCRNMISVSWEGDLYDYDFNRMLDISLAASCPHHVREFELAALERRRIAVDRHCVGCTAGAGSAVAAAQPEPSAPPPPKKGLRLVRPSSRTQAEVLPGAGAGTWQDPLPGFARAGISSDRGQ